MAIVKANFVKRGASARARAKANVRYIQGRPGRNGEKSERVLFGPDGAYLRKEVLRMIDSAPKGTLFYRIVISPDPRREDTIHDLDLKELTIQTMVHLEERLKTSVQFAAAEHNDHRPHRHVHVLALLPRKLTREELETLRASATRLSLLQRHIRDLRMERKITPKLTPKITSKPAARFTVTLPGRRSHSKQSAPQAHTRPRDRRQSIAPPKRGVLCPLLCTEHGQTMEWLSGRLFKCPSCGVVVRKDGAELQIQDRKLNLSNLL